LPEQKGGLSVVTTLCCPQDENPLSYDRLNGEWAQWFRTAQRFEHKVPARDRGDIRHSIILELALAGFAIKHKREIAKGIGVGTGIAIIVGIIEMELPSLLFPAIFGP
jgi:hypothetical protein